MYGERNKENNPVIATNNDLLKSEAIAAISSICYYIMLLGHTMKYRKLCTHSYSSAYFSSSNQYPNHNCIVCRDRIDNNGIECTICKYTYHFKCPDLPITSYYKTSNTWKCSKFKLIGPSSTCFFF